MCTVGTIVSSYIQLCDYAIIAHKYKEGILNLTFWEA